MLGDSGKFYGNASMAPFCKGTKALTFLIALFSSVPLPIGTVWAGNFQVTPIRIFLSGKTQSALLTLHNSSAETLRFQLSVHAWDQSPDGEILLKPTEDIVFFPPLLTLAPAEERKIRVGRVTPIAEIEKSYRISVEELPSLKRQEESQQGGQVRLLITMRIPIFLQPDKQVVAGRVQALTVRNGLLSFQVRNTGNTHFVAEEIKVRAYGAEGEALYEGGKEGWYILAGGLRTYDLELPKKDCARTKVLAVEVKTGRGTFQERLDVPRGACGQ